MCLGEAQDSGGVEARVGAEPPQCRWPRSFAPEAPLDRRSHQPLRRFAASSIASAPSGAGGNRNDLAECRRECDEQAAVVVERGEEVTDDALDLAPRLASFVAPTMQEL